MSKILVTGGAGFLGSHLCRSLIKNGDEVICLDNLYTGNLLNIEAIKENNKFHFINIDIEQFRIEDSNTPLLKDINQIYNLACPASPIHYQRDPVKTVRTNILGAINVLDLARSTSSRILQASTSEVYGDPEMHPQTEEYWGKVNPIGIRSCYDEGKRCVETLFFDYHRQYNVPIKIARIFNTYGPNMSLEDGRVVSNLIIQALKGQPLTIYGDGSQTRSFCYVTDLIEGLKLLMNSEIEINGPINLGNQAEYTMLELAQEIIRLTRSKSKIIFMPLPQDDPKQRRPSIELAISKLGWVPKINLEQGLTETIAYFESALIKKK